MRLEEIYKWLMENDPKDGNVHLWTVLADHIWFYQSSYPSSITSIQIFDLQTKANKFNIKIPTEFGIYVGNVYKQVMNDPLQEIKIIHQL